MDTDTPAGLAVGSDNYLVVGFFSHNNYLLSIFPDE